MELNKIRRMAAQILKVGKNKLWLNPDERDKIKESMTKEDVRALIKDGLIKIKKEKGQSKARARKLKEKKKKGRKGGYGKRKGRKKARARKKKSWVSGVRAQRKKLKELKNKGVKLSIQYRKAYNMIKGNYFKGKKYVEALAKEAEK